MSDSDSSRQVVRGQIVFEDDASAFSNATLYVTLEDVTYADSRAIIVGRVVKEHISYDPAAPEPLTFEMPVEVSERDALYNIRAHFDLNGDGKISQGDYLSMQSYPVITRGHPFEVSVRVSRVK